MNNRSDDCELVISSSKPRTRNLNFEGRATIARNGAPAKQNKIELLKYLLVEIQRGLEALEAVPTPPLEEGLDFYAEVNRFEKEIIRRALDLTGGCQVTAAKLLNLNATTLNAMIKRYDIHFLPRQDLRTK